MNEQQLIEEAIRRGFVAGATIKTINYPHGKKIKDYPNIDYWQNTGRLWIDLDNNQNEEIYIRGVWVAEVITPPLPNPKTQYQEVLLGLIQKDKVSYEDFAYLQGFRTRISELRNYVEGNF